MDNWTQIVITIVGVLGSGAIWKYLEARLKTKSAEKQTEIQNSDGVQYRDDLKNRVRNLESLLAKSSDEKDDMRSRIEELIGEVNALRVEVDYLKRENDRLKDKR
jgi:predicted nuclease with TOPRIM domain